MTLYFLPLSFFLFHAFCPSPSLPVLDFWHLFLQVVPVLYFAFWFALCLVFCILQFLISGLRLSLSKLTFCFVIRLPVCVLLLLPLRFNRDSSDIHLLLKAVPKLFLWLQNVSLLWFMTTFPLAVYCASKYAVLRCKHYSSPSSPYSFIKYRITDDKTKK